MLRLYKNNSLRKKTPQILRWRGETFVQHQEKNTVESFFWEKDHR